MSGEVILFESPGCTIFGLSGDNSQWDVRGKHGLMKLYYNASNPANIGLSWEKTETLIKLRWQLAPRKLKSKGDRAWVLRATNRDTQESEVLALRFPSGDAFNKFEYDFYSLMPKNLQDKYLSKKNKARNSNNKNNTNNNRIKPNTNIKNGNKHFYGETWECPQCTYNNEIHWNQCRMCSLFKPGSNENSSQNRNNHNNTNNNGNPKNNSKKNNNHNNNSNNNNNGNSVVLPFNTYQLPPQPTTQKQNYNQNYNQHQQNQVQLASSSQNPLNSNYLMQEWVCNTCSRINPSHLMKCQFCDGFKDAQNIRYSITHINDNVTTQNMNNSGISGGGGGGNLNQAQNQQQQHQQQMFRRMSPPHAQALTNQQWQCQACTLINYGTFQCSACGAQYLDMLTGNGANGSGNGNDNSNNNNSIVNNNNSNIGNNGSRHGGNNNNNSGNELALSALNLTDNRSNNSKAEDMQSVFSGYSTVTSNFGDKTEELNKVANDICILNANPGPIFHTLKTVTRKLVKNDIKYRILDTTNPKVTERLLGFEGVLDFLTILGFESDFLNYKLICNIKPSQQVIDKALEILTNYENQFSVGKMPMLTPMQTTRSTVGGMSMGMGMGTKKDTFDDIVSESGFLSSVGSPTGIQPMTPTTDGTFTPNTLTQGDGSILNGDNNNNNNGFGNDIGNANQLQANQSVVDEESELTLDQIILWSTHENSRDFETMKTLIMTHKTFTDSITLLRALRRRFWSEHVPQNIQNDVQKVQEFQTKVLRKIQLKAVKALREWMKYYWDSDFAGTTDDKVLIRQEVQEWIDFMMFNNDDLLGGPWNKVIATKLNKEFKRYKAKGGKFVKNPIRDYGDVKISPELNFNGMLDCSAYEIACQITLMDFDVFRRIDSRECLGQAWKDKKRKHILAPNILLLINRSNYLSSLVQYSILKCDGLNNRIKMLKKCIKIGEELRSLKNYHSLCAVWSGLNSNQIYKLSSAWDGLPKKQHCIYKQFGILFLSSKSWRNMRTIINSTPPPAIPYLGLILQDLVFIDDGTKKDIKIGQNKNATNFHKMARLALCSKNITRFQNEGYYENNVIKKDDKILAKYLINMYDTCAKLTEDDLWNMSEACKVGDKKEAQKKNDS